MKKWTMEDEERYLPFIEEAERDIEINGTIPEEEFWKLVEEDERREGLYKSTRNIGNIRLHLAKTLGKISRRFVRI